MTKELSSQQLDKEQLFEVIVREGVEAFNAYRQQTNNTHLDLSGLDFTAKDLTGINFSNTNLSHCSFDFAYLADADFTDCQMNRCSCRESDFYTAVLDDVEMLYSDLYKGNFGGASFVGATMTGVTAAEANFAEADFTKANLQKAVLHDTDFSGAILNGTSFKDAKAHYGNFEGVVKDAKTVLPELFPPDSEESSD